MSKLKQFFEKRPKFKEILTAEWQFAGKHVSKNNMRAYAVAGVAMLSGGAVLDQQGYQMPTWDQISLKTNQLVQQSEQYGQDIVNLASTVTMDDLYKIAVSSADSMEQSLRNVVDEYTTIASAYIADSLGKTTAEDQKIIEAVNEVYENEGISLKPKEPASNMSLVR